jgi:hypothetical protein
VKLRQKNAVRARGNRSETNRKTGKQEYKKSTQRYKKEKTKIRRGK